MDDVGLALADDSSRCMTRPKKSRATAVLAADRPFTSVFYVHVMSVGSCVSSVISALTASELST